MTGVAKNNFVTTNSVKNATAEFTSGVGLEHGGAPSGIPNDGEEAPDQQEAFENHYLPTLSDMNDSVNIKKRNPLKSLGKKISKIGGKLKKSARPDALNLSS